MRAGLSSPARMVFVSRSSWTESVVSGEILALIRRIQKEMNMALLLISHDLGVVSHMCDRVYVMFRGKIIEEGPATEIFESPKHPYTIGLLNSALAVRDKHGRFVTMESETLQA